MAHTKRALLTLFCWCSLSNILCAQIAPANSMRLYRTQSGHYAFHTLLNDRVLSSVMIESGIHAALIDSAFIHKHQHELGLTIRPNNMNKEINLGGTVYRITHRAKGNLKMNGCVYEGEFLVLSHYRNETEVTIPIQRLRQKDDWGSRIVMLDIKNNQMRMLTRNELRSWDCPRHKMNHRSYMRMPAISTTIAITTSESTLFLEGNFNIDLGNPMPLYLREQSDNPHGRIQPTRRNSGTSFQALRLRDIGSLIHTAHHLHHRQIATIHHRRTYRTTPLHGTCRSI